MESPLCLTRSVVLAKGEQVQLRLATGLGGRVLLKAAWDPEGLTHNGFDGQLIFTVVD